MAADPLYTLRKLTAGLLGGFIGASGHFGVPLWYVVLHVAVLVSYVELWGRTTRRLRDDD